MKVPDKIVKRVLSNMADHILDNEDRIPKDKKLRKFARAYMALLRTANKHFHVNLPFFKVRPYVYYALFQSR